MSDGCIYNIRSYQFAIHADRQSEIKRMQVVILKIGIQRHPMDKLVTITVVNTMDALGSVSNAIMHAESRIV